MSLKLHWLIYILLEGKIVPHDVCIDLLEAFGDEIDADQFAQDAYNAVSIHLDEPKAKKLLDSFEEALQLAEEMSEKGEPVPEFQDKDKSEPEEKKAKTVKAPPENADIKKELTQLLENMLEGSLHSGSSNLHIVPYVPPYVRRNKNIEFIGEFPLKPEESFSLNTVLLSEHQKEVLESQKEAVFIVDLGNLRYRLTLYRHRKGLSGIYHILPDKIKSLEELGFKENTIYTMEKFLDNYSGLVLVVSPQNGGMSSTIAAIIEVLNKKRKNHIVTIERNLEFLHKSLNCSISQREIGVHVKSFVNAFNNAINVDADIIVVDNLKEHNQIKLALDASESGHLVVAGISAYDTINALTRIVNFFPLEQQDKIRVQLAENLKGVLCQKLVYDTSDKMVPAVEMLVNTISVSNNITEGKFYLLRPAMQVDKKFGMCIMDDYIYELFREGTISDKVALNNIVNKKQYEKMISSSKL